MLSNIHRASPPMRQRSFGFSFFTGLIAAVSLIMVLSASAEAATPSANSVISNQATANYKDSGGTDQVASSNLVTTTVEQIGSYTLTADNTKTAAPGTTVYMPHTLTNTGNGTDSFNITLPAGFDTGYLNSVSIYADTNGDGSPDGAALCSAPNCTGSTVSTGPLAAGASYNFIVAFAVKAGASNGSITPEVVTAVPASTGALLASYPAGASSPPATNGAAYGTNHEKINTDNLTVSNTDPVFAVTKSIVGQTSGPIGSNVVYKLSYTNSGNAAGPLYIKDLIGTGTTASYSYVSGATWSNSGATVLTDATGGDPTGIDYKAVTATGITTIEAVVASVPANASGFITFTVHVDAGAPLGSSETTNVANYGRASETGVDCTTLPCTPTGTLSTTNQSPFSVTGNYSVVANNSSGSAVDGDNTAASGNDVVTAVAVAPGQVVSFNNYIHNTGTATDTFNITYNANNVGGATAFPTGTTFQLFQSDGSTLLTSSDADGIPDTGPLVSGGTYKVVLKATIPANACSLIDCATASNFTVAKIATSTGSANPTIANGGRNIVFDQLAAITPPGVDLTNNGIVDGDGPGAADSSTPITTVITTKTVAPGSDAQFDLSVTNDGLASDNYNLSYHLTTGGTIALNGFVPGTSLSGWSVTIHSGICSTSLGPVVSNTGAIASHATAAFCAVVNTAASGATAAAGTYNVYFEVTSGATTGASDIKLDAVILSSQNILTLTPSGTGQIQPGGTILYPHTLLNGGNNTCNGAFTFNVTNNGAATGWSYVLYYDVDGDGVVDSTDPVIGGGTNASDTGLTSTIPALVAGTNAKLLVKVQAPSGASSGANDVISVTAIDGTGSTPATCGITSAATDTTTILAGQIRLVKTQALGLWNSTSSSCDAPTGAYSGSGTTLSQKPGDCVWYRIIASNEGDAAVTDVKINDATPTFTTYGGGGSCAAVAGTPAPTPGTLTGTFPALAGTGSVTCGTWTTVPASTKLQLDFAVRINP